LWLQAETETDEVFAQITLQPDPDVSGDHHRFFFLLFCCALVASSDGFGMYFVLLPCSTIVVILLGSP
jgi:hypothetical protein